MPQSQTDQIITITIAPCPFCGEDAKVSPDKSGGFWFVECGWCGAVGPNAKSLTEAAQNWNERLTKAERDARATESDDAED